MAIDFNLTQKKDYWDLDIENGDIAKTDSLDTALYMSVFCERRSDKVSEPTLRRGHFTNAFNRVAGYETQSNLTMIETSVKDGLKWMIDDSIISKTNVKATKQDTKVSIEVDLINKLQVNSKYYNLFLNL